MVANPKWNEKFTIAIQAQSCVLLIYASLTRIQHTYVPHALMSSPRSVNFCILLIPVSFPNMLPVNASTALQMKIEKTQVSGISLRPPVTNKKV